MYDNPFCCEVIPDWRGFVDRILRRGKPDRVYYIELFLDREVQDAILNRFRLTEDLDFRSPDFPFQSMVRLQRFLGYDYVRCGVDGVAMTLKRHAAEDTAELKREAGRSYMEEHAGPITNWDEFERYPWPDMDKVGTQSLEWHQKNLPEDMCIVGSGGFAHFAEHLCWLMGYETLCYALADQRDLVRAIADRCAAIFRRSLELMLQFDRVKVIWGSDDMGFKNGPLLSPADLREFVLPGHRLMAEMSHAAGRPYILHSCGNLDSIMEDLIEDVGIDGKHSFEDTITDVIVEKEKYGSRISLLGGIDVDFLCRSKPEQVRARVRRTLEKCHPAGGYLLGSGNSIANYIPLNNYLAMLDEGRRFGT